MSRYELHGAPSGRTWHMAPEFGDGSPMTEASALEAAQMFGWELREISDDGSSRVVWSPPAPLPANENEISEAAAEAVAEVLMLDAELRGFSVPDDAQ